MKKIFNFILLIMVIMPISLFAVSSDEVDYIVDDYIVDANIDISGNLVIKEIIGIKGTYNGYIRDLVFKNDKVTEFTGTDSDFEGSSIYNGSNIALYKVGKIEYNGELDFKAFEQEIIEFSECSDKTNCYEKTTTDDGLSLKMYNETINDITYFYIEYLIGNVIVMHNDIAELYYNFIGYDFDDEIERYQLRVVLPDPTTEQIRVWAHGPLTGEVSFIVDEEENPTYYGGYLIVNNLNPNTPVDMRMTFSKDLILVDHPFQKKTNIDGLDKILKVEEQRADEANKERKKATILTNGTYVLSGTYFLITAALFVYVYLKYDKEPKTSFEGEYYREFIDEYDVTNIEYLFDKKITEKAFSTSILNMIYKKNITFEQTDKKDYTFTKVSEDGLDNNEKLIMKIIFDEAGNGKTTTLKSIKNYASKIHGTTSDFLNSYNLWKNGVTSDSIKQNFYEKKSKVGLIATLLVISGFLIIYMQATIGIKPIFTFITFLLMFSFVIYCIVFKKRTIRGAEHYEKWKAFKRFLKDFGRFDEKELPEIALWERYLVYASIFGIADEVGKTMKIKFNEMNVNDNRDFIFDYLLFTSLNNNLSRCINSSVGTAVSKVNEAKAAEISSSSSSSGGGFGGGFSSGGGFGGGGGGGRGF